MDEMFSFFVRRGFFCSLVSRQISCALAIIRSYADDDIMR